MLYIQRHAENKIYSTNWTALPTTHKNDSIVVLHGQAKQHSHFFFKKNLVFLLLYDFKWSIPVRLSWLWHCNNWRQWLFQSALNQFHWALKTNHSRSGRHWFMKKCLKYVCEVCRLLVVIFHWQWMRRQGMLMEFSMESGLYRK